MTDPQTQTPDDERRVVEMLREGRKRIETELEKVIVGQKSVIEQVLIAMSQG